ncbi:MAG: 3-isopropylmalate dehydratase large subunit [bacterium]|jgi:3-isopropylmalate/(R)-2-methylmalate dehydratase large subunit
MEPMHAVHKILARAAGKDYVKAGQIIMARVDVAGVNDIYPQVVHSFRAMGARKVFAPEKIVFIFDHHAPPATVSAADNQKMMRDFCQELGIENLTDINAGICHQVLVERGFSRPDRLMVVTDSHSTSHGALGAFSTGVGATDMAGVLVSGELWLRVPEVVLVEFTGTLPPGVMAKDLALFLLGRLGTRFALYKTLEFAGEVIDRMPTAERMVLCNMAVEMGAKAAYIAPDAETYSYLQEKAGLGLQGEAFQTDPGFAYEAVYPFDVSELEPLVACPHGVDRVTPVSQLAPVAVNQAFIGSCIGGRLEDLAVAAEVLRGRSLAPGVRLLVTPSSTRELQEAMARGYIQDLLAAGATLATPGCGACCGVHLGLIGAGEVCVTASARNFRGRMGSNDSQVYVASPRTVALAALQGYLGTGS